jgi:hypothetical protein
MMFSVSGYSTDQADVAISNLVMDNIEAENEDVATIKFKVYFSEKLGVHESRIVADKVTLKGKFDV